MGGMTRLLLLLWVGVAVSTVVDLQKRIIGGQPCRPNERLYHVKITDGKGDLICGGSLISNRWILTAAHCLDKTMNAVLGVHPGPGQTVRITAPPVVFKDNNNNRFHDIMLLKLPNPVTQIQPVKLPDCGNRPNIGAIVQIAGHGDTTAGLNNRRKPGISSTLQCANIQLVDCQRLRHIVNYAGPHKLYQHWFCGQTPGVDACPGDSGGGVVYNGMIYGVISFTGDADYACTEAVAFMDVCEYMNWIKQTTAKTLTDKVKACLGCG